MSTPRLKPLRQQTIVLTGATSGIGLATARMAAERGASLVLVARNEDALRELRDELRGRGARAEYAVADVGDVAQVEAAARVAVDSFGGFDSWVNDAGASVYGRMDEVPLEDQRRLFDTLYWGVVHGTLVAARHLRGKTGGGAIVNVGSVLSDRAILMQGAYSAAKHAVLGATNAFRMESERAGQPISVSLVKPAGIATPFADHARNYMEGGAPTVPPPVYHPRVVARGILHCCETPTRDLYVGGGGAMISLMGTVAPRLTDLVMEAVGVQGQQTQQRPDPARRDNLYAPRSVLAEEVSTDPVGPVRKTSLLMEAQMNPLGTAGVLAGVGALVVGAAIGMSHRRRSFERTVGSETRRAALAAAEEASRIARRGAREARRGGLRLFAALRDDALPAVEDAAREGRRKGRGLFDSLAERVAPVAETVAERAERLADEARREGYRLVREGRRAARRRGWLD